MIQFNRLLISSTCSTLLVDRYLLLAVEVTTSWMLSLSVNSMPRSKVHRNATLLGGFSSVKRSLLRGMIPKLMKSQQTSSISRLCEASNLENTDVTGSVHSAFSNKLACFVWKSIISKCHWLTCHIRAVKFNDITIFTVYYKWQSIAVTGTLELQLRNCGFDSWQCNLLLAEGQWCCATRKDSNGSLTPGLWQLCHLWADCLEWDLLQTQCWLSSIFTFTIFTFLLDAFVLICKGHHTNCYMKMMMIMISYLLYSVLNVYFSCFFEFFVLLLCCQ